MIKDKLKKKKSGENISLGDHICSIYQTKEQQFALVVPFFKAGLEANQKCIYIADENSDKEIILQFKKRGIDLEKNIHTKQFMLLSKKQTYLKEGSFDPDRMIRLLKEVEEDALKEG
jgi:KaiC/GvpD/RAD55 family RecA-like ATPase